jgi:MtN3 and saliva related transmembrane protein
MDTLTIIGFVAAIFTTVSFLPEAIKVIKTKQTKDLSLGMYLAFTIGVSLWTVYGIIGAYLPIIIANSITLVFALVILIMKVKYK